MIPTRKIDEQFSALFSIPHPFSEHLTKREDDQLRDKYDHNAFFYSGQPSADEVRAALAYQKERGDTFFKLEGYEPLDNAFGIEKEAAQISSCIFLNSCYTITAIVPKAARRGSRN